MPIGRRSSGPDIDTNINTRHVDTDVDGPDVRRTQGSAPSSGRSPSPGGSPGPRVGKTPPPKPPRSPQASAQAASLASGSPSPLVGTIAPTTAVAGPAAPRPPGSTWVMAQPVGGGGARITYLRTASPTATSTTLARPTIDPGAPSLHTTGSPATNPGTGGGANAHTGGGDGRPRSNSTPDGGRSDTDLDVPGDARPRADSAPGDLDPNSRHDAGPDGPTTANSAGDAAPPGPHTDTNPHPGDGPASGPTHANDGSTTSAHATGPAATRPAKKPPSPLPPSPGTPITGPYKKVEALSTQMQFEADGRIVGNSGADLERIRAQRRAKGLPDNELACRMELVDRRIRQAYHVRQTRNTADPGGRKDVLSVFTAPEWAFKMPGTPMTPKQRDQVIRHYRDLSKQHPGMLIVPGTMVTDVGKPPRRLIEAEAIVVHNGQIVKRTRKANEGYDVTGYTHGDGSRVRRDDFHGLKSTPAGPSAFENDSSVFEFEGMKFSLEICADHGSHRAITDVERSGGTGVDVQILISDGASINKGDVAAHAGGVVITNDAKLHSDHAGTRPGGIRQVSRPGNYKDELAADSEENLGELSASAPVEIVR